MPFLVVPDPSNSHNASFMGFPSAKRRRKAIARILKSLERLRNDEYFFLRLTSGFPLANPSGCFDGDDSYKLTADFLNSAIADLHRFLELF